MSPIPRHRLFALAYASPDSETYLNGKQSYQRAYPAANGNTARANASNLLADNAVAQDVERIAEAYGMGISSRIAQRAEIASGRGVRTTRTYGERDGERYLQSETISEPTFKDRLTALDQLDKATGYAERVKTRESVRRHGLRALMDSVVRGLEGVGGFSESLSGDGNGVRNDPDDLVERGIKQREGDSGEGGKHV